jgi:hypothetical protein
MEPSKDCWGTCKNSNSFEYEDEDEDEASDGDEETTPASAAVRF